MKSSSLFLLFFFALLREVQRWLLFSPIIDRRANTGRRESQQMFGNKYKAEGCFVLLVFEKESIDKLLFQKNFFWRKQKRT